MPCATIQHALDSAAVNDTITVEQGSYSESLTITTQKLTLRGAQAGVDARGRNSTESELTGYINIDGNADSLTIDGFSILEGATISGSKAGIYISNNATNITIQNNLFTRSGTVDGDSYRGILNAIGGAQTGLLIQNNSFTGWATGVYLNPGPTAAQLLNNDFIGNFVGVSVDGPDSTIFTGNSFNDNLFEGLGIGPWTDSGNPAPDPLVGTFTNNSFSSDSNYIGLYSGVSSEFDFSNTSFEGTAASAMSTSQLLSAEKKIGHGVDASGGYSGFALLKTDHVFVTDGNSIATALGFVSSGWTIYVDAGTYEAFSIGLSGPSNLNIQGVSGATVSRDSSALNRIVDLRSDSLTFNGFTVKGGGTHVGISVTGQGLTISNNTIDSVLTGIQTTTQYTDGKNTITGNTITNSGYGISLQNNQNTITGNTITVTTEGFGIGSSANTVTGNQLTMSANGTPLQTYSGGSLPGADVNILSALNNNTFNRAVIVRNSSGVSEETIFGNIQEAVDSASVKDSVLVNTGSFSEEVTISKKGIVLSGKSAATLNVERGNTGITISADSVVVRDLTIQGPYSLDFETVDWDTMANAFGTTISSSDVLITNNTINNLRTGLSFVSGSSGIASNNKINNTKGSILVRTDSLTITGNEPGEKGSEWDIVFLTVSDGAYTTSPTVSELEYSRDLVQLSKSNGEMSVLDRRYGSNGLSGLASTVGNRTHIYVSAGSSFTASDDFDLGNGLGNARQPLDSVKTGIDAVVIGGSVVVQQGSYTENNLSIDKDSLSLKFSSGVSGIDSLIFDSSPSDLTISGIENSLLIIGNTNDNQFNISGDKIEVEGGSGSDTVVLSGNRSDYTISDNSGVFSFVNGSSENKSSEVEFSTFDDITIALNFAAPVSYPGRSITFGDNSSSLSIPDDNSLDATGALSIEFWMKTSGFTSSNQSILFKGSDAWSLHRYSSTNFLAFTTYHSGSPNTLFGNVSVADDEWHHVAVVYNGSQKLLYIDGKLDASNTVSGNLDTNSETMTIGGWTGSIDELRFWTIARDSNEIRNNSFQQLEGDETGLQGYWRMDEGSGSLVGDLTSNSNDAYIAANSSISWKSTSHPIGTFITGDEGWRIITSPADGVTYGELLSDIWTQGFTGADTESGSPNVFIYNEGDGNTDASSRGFQSIGSSSEMATTGEALVVYVYEDNDPGTAQIEGDFPKVIKTDSAQHSGTITTSLSLTKSGAGGSYDADNDGWNLIGNPFATSIDWDASSGWNRSGIDNSIYVWSDSANSGTGAYLSWNGVSGTLGSGKIAPMQGFWVKANNTGSLSFSVNDTARSNGAVLLKQKIVPEILFRLDGAGLSNTTVMMFTGLASREKDAFDAYKLHSLNEQYLSLSTKLEDGTGLDINALPIELESDLAIPLAIDGSELSGSFKLSWAPRNIPENLNVTLVDTYANLEIDLASTSNYIFEIEAGSNSKSKSTAQEHWPNTQGPYPSIHKTKTNHSSRFEIQVSNTLSTNSEPVNGIPASLTLEQNYPNPFNPDTQIEFALPNRTKVRLTVYDILGRTVATILEEQLMDPGYYSLPFQSNGLSSGVYLYELTTGGSRIVKRMTLLK